MKNIFLLTFSDIKKGTRLKFVANKKIIFIDEFTEYDANEFINNNNNNNTIIIFGYHIEKLSAKDKELLFDLSERFNDVFLKLNDVKIANIVYDKFLTYQIFSKSRSLKIPKFENIENRNQLIKDHKFTCQSKNSSKKLSKMDFDYPVILCSNKSSGGTNMYLC